MIIEQIVDENHVKHYSDRDMMIRQEETGILYEDAVDVIPCRYTYTETDTPIPADPATDEDYMTIGKIMMGVEE